MEMSYETILNSAHLFNEYISKVCKDYNKYDNSKLVHVLRRIIIKNLDNKSNFELFGG